MEIAWREQLTFLPGLLNGLGVSANYSYTYSQARVPGRSDLPALIRQGPNNWNAGLTYDKRRFSYRLGISHNDAYIYAYNYSDGADGGLKGPNGDNYLYAHTQVDMQGELPPEPRRDNDRRRVECQQRSIRLLPGQRYLSYPARILPPYLRSWHAVGAFRRTEVNQGREPNLQLPLRFIVMPQARPSVPLPSPASIGLSTVQVFRSITPTLPAFTHDT